MKIPRSVAIIMDGNGRWAKEKGLPRVEGHKAGAESVRVITRACAEKGVENLVLYAFSLENFKRPRDEVDYLMRLLKRFLARERKDILDNDIRFKVIGRREKLPGDVVRLIEIMEKESESNAGMRLVLALAYGGRSEIVDAVKAISRMVASGGMEIEKIDEDTFSEYLYDPLTKDIDLLIRTAGEKRVSNFLLWQISYAELFVSDVCWPDFREEHLEEAFEDFGKRIRKFGGLVPGDG